MNSQWKAAVLGALGGAALAVAIVFAAASNGYLPGAGSGREIHDYLLAHPQILADMNDKLQAQQDAEDSSARQKAVDQIGQSAFFNPKVAFVTGPANARTTFVELFDYNCPFCRLSLPAVKKFYEANKAKARFAFIEFPIKGPQSTVAARAALAARNQPDKYLPFHFALMKEEGLVDENTVYADAAKVGIDVAKLKADMNDPSIQSSVEASLALAKKAKVDGTPAFIVNGKVREGAIDDDLLKELMKG
jgi:protein-disulfide isomerase